ncbi:MAG: family 10 glycosylhydrolase [Candidatus Omnitrophica bacterium]|nr:family 10 glycosylhydrolase [Candidatus Omnitrophota bacterium]
MSSLPLNKAAVLLALGLAAGIFLPSVGDAGPASDPPLGLWITCLDPESPLNNPGQVEKLVSFAEQGKFKILFVQVYRADKAWFLSETADSSPYLEAREKAGGIDPLQELIDRAHGKGIEVHAWINTLTLSRNFQSAFLKESGDEILTKDQYGNSAVKNEEALEAPYRYYEQENQLFLEPGDPRVKERVLRVVAELIRAYPTLDGIHFDYIRYPAAPPFIPGSRFNAVGLSYGYGERNVERFRQAHGFDPHDVRGQADKALLWDRWKREQITELLRECSRQIKASDPSKQVSCAVVPSFDRAYHAAGQDWGKWLEENIIDFAVLMNYSVDHRAVWLGSRAAVGIAGDPRRIAIGLGAYLLEKDPTAFQEQIDASRRLGPRAVVLFDYSAASRLSTAKSVSMDEE